MRKYLVKNQNVSTVIDYSISNIKLVRILLSTLYDFVYEKNLKKK